MNDDKNENFEAQLFGLPIADPQDVDRGRDPLEVLATEFIDAIRSGRHPRIEEFVRREPALEAEIHDLFPLLARMEGWKAYRQGVSLEHRELDTLSSEHFGDFRIIREIGRGAMGIVFEAEEGASKRHVAVKVLPFATNDRMRENFEREARTAAALDHPHIVPVFDFGQSEGVCYNVMPIIEGVGLDWIIERLNGRQGVIRADDIREQFALGGSSADIEQRGEQRRNFLMPGSRPALEAAAKSDDEQAGPLAEGIGRDSWLEMARICAQVADALQYAHSQGTLHRDIKPANLLLDAQGDAWITDFGLAKSTAELMVAVDSSPAGTLRYIAPEQFAGRVDARSDIYSLGVTLFELLTRTPVFSTQDRKGLVDQIQHAAIPRPRDRNRWVPYNLDAIVGKATAKDPAQRYSTVGQMRDDLLWFFQGKRVHAAGLRGWLRFGN
ncbi:MAG: serine/threonine-protein kinase [Planctomycetaceae bacterium]